MFKGLYSRIIALSESAHAPYALAVVAFAIFNWLVSDKQQPEWVKTAKTRPLLTSAADKIVALLPEDAAATVDAWIKSRGAVTPANEEPIEESSAPTEVRPTPPPMLASPPGAPKKADASAPSTSVSDKQKLDALINGRPFPAAPKQ